MSAVPLPTALRYSLVIIATLATIFASLTGLATPEKARADSLPGPFATILFSRTEMTAADNCAPHDTNIARLDTEVAPYLKSLGLTATGTLTPDRMMQSADRCVHYNDTMMGSWDDAQNLATNFGWSFVSHTASYPNNLPGLTPAQSDAETCGSANTIAAHGLHGAHGYIAYPGTAGDATAVQTNYASKCFAWGRQYGGSGLTSSTSGTTAPYWQHTHAGNGGRCATASQPCSGISMQNGSTKYTQPSELIGYVNSLAPGRWFTFQSFILVEGKSPPYSKGNVQWDCTSPNPALHWTNDNERYCYNDFQAVVAAIVAKGAQVTDPLTVGVAFGRPATYPRSALTTADTTPPTAPDHLQAAADSGDADVATSWGSSIDDVGVTGYQLERSTDQASWSTIYTGAATSYRDESTAFDTRYYYRVEALDAAGNASAYATADATTWSPPPDITAPSVPGNFQVAADSEAADVATSWDPSTDDVGVTGYQLQRSADQESWSTVYEGTATSYRDDSTAFDTHYYYRLTALDAAGHASDYAVGDVTTPPAPRRDTTPPSVPDAFLAATNTTNSTVALSWTAATDDTAVTAYQLDRSSDQTNWAVLSGTLTGTSYSDASAGYGAHYYYRVRAVDAAGNASGYAVTDVMTAPPKVTQYVTNPSLEGGTAVGWMPYSSNSAVAAFRVPGGSQDGSYALKATNNGAGAAAAGLMDKGPHYVNNTVANRTYVGSMWLSGTANTTVTVQLRECNAAGTSCPGAASANVKLPASGWVRVTTSYAAKANGNQLRFSAYSTIPAKGSFLADALSLTAPN